VPIFKTIGMGLGMIFWGSVSLIAGWATARFNLFGLNENPPTNTGLNYAGVALTLVSTIFYIFVKSDTTKSKSSEKLHPEAVEKLNENGVNSSDMIDENLIQDRSDLFDRLSPTVKRIVGNVEKFFSLNNYFILILYKLRHFISNFFGSLIWRSVYADFIC
jgi:hypothetical protein